MAPTCPKGILENLFSWHPAFNNTFAQTICKGNNKTTGEPRLSGYLLSGHPRLRGQLSKSRNYCQYNTANKTLIKRPPLLNGRGRLLAVPMRAFLLFLPRLSGHQESNTPSWLVLKNLMTGKVQNRR